MLNVTPRLTAYLTKTLLMKFRFNVHIKGKYWLTLLLVMFMLKNSSIHLNSTVNIPENLTSTESTSIFTYTIWHNIFSLKFEISVVKIRRNTNYSIHAVLCII